MELSVWLPLEVKLTSQFQTALLRTLLWTHREGKIPEALRIGLSPKCFYRDLFVIADLNELMSMNLLIQTCAGNFFFVRAKSSGGKYYREANDWTGSSSLFYFFSLLEAAICRFPWRSTYTTTHEQNLYQNTVRRIMHKEIISSRQVTWRVSAN